MRVGPIRAIVISGAIWLVIGGMLTYKGLVLLARSVATFAHNPGPLMKGLYQLFQNVERSGMILVFTAILLGQLKGTFILAKSVKRFIKRILLIPSPIPLKALFPWNYLALVGGMMALGIALRISSIPTDIKAFIDLAVGSALISGAFLYFRQASMLKMEFSKRKK